MVTNHECERTTHFKDITIAITRECPEAKRQESDQHSTWRSLHGDSLRVLTYPSSDHWTSKAEDQCSSTSDWRSQGQPHLTQRPSQLHHLRSVWPDNNSSIFVTTSDKTNTARNSNCGTTPLIRVCCNMCPDATSISGIEHNRMKTDHSALCWLVIGAQ